MGAGAGVMVWATEATMKATAVRATRPPVQTTRKVQAARPMSQRATRVQDAVDVLLGAADGASGFKRIDCAVSRTSSGGLHVEIEVPGQPTGPVRTFV
jgi:hypothetical protein